jgi:arginine:pyruvate transaminase
MRASARIAGITGGGGHGWAVHERAREMQAAGRDVTLLTVGDHDIKTDAAVIDAMDASARSGNLGYSPVAGTPALRAAIAKRIAATTGVATAPEEVLVTAGGQAALFFAMMAALDPGDACLLIEPFYATFPLTVRAASGRVVSLDAPAETGFVPRPEEIDAKLAETGARAMLLNSPNNPTGAVYDRAFWEAVAEICIARDVWLISDEVYESQVHDGERVTPRALPGMAQRTLVLGSMSKSHAMTGWRVGWLVGPESVIGYGADYAIASTYGIPGFIQDAALFALGQEDDIDRTIAARYRRRRDAALAAIEGARGVRAHRPAGGMYLMLDIRQTGMSGTDFALDLLETEGVAVMPGESFGAAAAGHLRVALTVPEAVLVPALRRLVAHADRLAARRAA